MKNLTKIFVAVAVALFAFSCVNDVTEDIAVKVGGKTTLAISLDDTRTELGEKEDGVYPVTWSAGDQITVNGVTSDPLTFADGAGTTNAVFTFNTESLEAPYRVAYPAADEGYVVFAPEQIHNPSGSTFDKGAATMYGYSNGGRVKLNHLTGVLKIGVVGNATLKSATISTIDRAPIAGPFAIDFTTCALTPTENSTNTIVYQFAGMDGQYLDETEPTYLHIAVPAGTYDELYVTLVDDQGGMMITTIKAGDNKPLAAGKVREFNEPITYAPISSDEVFIVKDYESLLAFTTAAAKATSKAPVTKDAVFIGDVEIPSSGWTSVSAEYYTGTICGNGHIISGLNSPLFERLGATVKGLHLTNINITQNAVANFGVLASVYAGAGVSHCSLSGSVTLNKFSGSTARRCGTMIGCLLTGAKDVEISNCVNKCDLNINFTASGTAYLAIGTIFGTCKDITGTLIVRNVVNEGSINTSGNTYGKIRLGGIAGYIGGYTKVTMENCVNKGEINYLNQDTSGSVCVTAIGGLIASMTINSSINFSMSNCHNKGNVTVDTPYMQRGLYFGGLVGEFNCSGTSSSSISNCSNTKAVTADIDNCVPNDLGDGVGCANCISAMVGYLNVSGTPTLSIQDVLNSAKLTCSGYSGLETPNRKCTGNDATYVYAGSIIAKMEKTDSNTPSYTFNNWVNTGDVEVLIAAAGINEAESYFGALVGRLADPTVTNAKNYGAFKVYQTKEDGTYSTYANAGMLAGSASATFANSAVGGTFVYGNGAELTSVELAIDNYTKYLFSNRDLTEYAGVSLLTSAPAAN